MNEEKFNAFCETQEAIWSILVREKGYYEVNYSHEFLENHQIAPCLIMYSNRCGRFVKNLQKFGYDAIIKHNGYTNYLREVFIKDCQGGIVDPSTMIPIFKKFDEWGRKS